jgi:hypothetical protein
LLKDPVFLLAAISKTNFSTFHFKYINLCAQLEMDFRNNDSNSIGICFNQLYNIFAEVFNDMRRWTRYMELSPDEYLLKSYVLQQVKTVFNNYFWALISFRQDLFLSEFIPGFKIPDHDKLTSLETNDPNWDQNKYKSPYWETLGLQHPVKNNTPGDLLHALMKTGNELFYFFNTIIHHSNKAFERMKNGKCNNHETALLRSFVKLLMDERQQLNGISKKHLQLYYKDILKQEELSLVGQERSSVDEKASEYEMKIYRSVANRIKTKERVLSREDYFSLIRQEFPDIYYSKTIFNVSGKSIDVYVVQSVQNIAEPNAFMPLTDESKKSEIQKYLAERAPAFYKIRVLDFLQYPLQITAQVILKKEVDAPSKQVEIIKALNLFLSPWILSDAQKIVIDKSISDDQVVVMIQSMEGIEKVQAVSFTQGSNNTNEIRSAGENFLLVSGMDHIIQFIIPA